MSIPLIRWGARQIKRSPGPGVTVKILKSKDKVLVKTPNGIKGFIWKGNVHAREGDDRLPIKRLYGPSFLALLKRPENNEQIIVRGVDRFKDRVVHNAEKLLDGTWK